jgi:hypothetical protein
VAVVTSSGFLFEHRGGSVVLRRCPRGLVPAAELEYLREVEPRGVGRIRAVEKKSEEGREKHVVCVDVPGGPTEVTFDVGPALLGRLKEAHEVLGLIVYGIAGVTAVGTTGYLVARFFGLA